MRRAVFLDRDGTINEEVNYLQAIDDLRIINGACSGIKRLNDAGFLVIVVTNQSGVARGLFDEEFLDVLHREMLNRLDRCGARIDAFYYCPHHPSEGQGIYRTDCRCRKPSTGLIERACADFSIDVNRSFVVGDAQRDMRLAWNVGAGSVLVLTGYGTDSLRGLPISERQRIDYVAADLGEAARWICAQ